MRSEVLQKIADILDWISWEAFGYNPYLENKLNWRLRMGERLSRWASMLNSRSYKILYGPLPNIFEIDDVKDYLERNPELELSDVGIREYDSSKPYFVVVFREPSGEPFLVPCVAPPEINLEQLKREYKKIL